MTRKRHCKAMIALARRIARHEGGEVCLSHKYPTVHTQSMTFTVVAQAEVIWGAGEVAGGGASGNEWINRLWPVQANNPSERPRLPASAPRLSRE